MQQKLSIHRCEQDFEPNDFLLFQNDQRRSSLIVDDQNILHNIEAELKYITTARITILKKEAPEKRTIKPQCKIYEFKQYLYFKDDDSDWDLTIDIDLAYAKIKYKIDQFKINDIAQIIIEKNNTVLTLENKDRCLLNEGRIDKFNKDFLKNMRYKLDFYCIWNYDPIEFEFRKKLGSGSSGIVYLVKINQQKSFKVTCGKYALKCLESLQSQNIIHKDITPQNILLEQKKWDTWIYRPRDSQRQLPQFEK
ncbi:UNKNOWN [Stylonychia lemnae]|uniref:Protein kinase domain-containing protein n=1 Tax=Stylonychia lemnae TaxID=5949 RepID=A0A078B3T2_STYLE|nr:UNKNOWN [Stylonychia lemnae]|eukprot:CDW88168.1 UNKNOWN [Stylonychia lemnae]